MLLFAWLACGDEEPVQPAPEPVEAPAVTTSQVDPERVCDRSACGTVTGPDGGPVKGAWIQVLRSDGVEDEMSELGPDGRWVLHLREENAGPPPWQLNIGAPGHIYEIVDVPNPIPEEGVTLDVQLKVAD